MGLFDFVKNAGEKIFQRDKVEANKAADRQAADARKAAVLKNQVTRVGIAVENLTVTFSDGEATIGGTCPSQSDREKVILIVGNTQGVARVEDRLKVVVPTPAAVFYTVRRGDTLAKIAKAHYGNAMRYPVIFEANRPMLADPDKIYPGQVLRIPAQAEKSARSG